ncbi:PHP domain protein [Desulfovibrio sp. X2]|uniref:PHP domain-containing protein n=1 Tax=Desulfovibrio sp. X2 TaxID=941449 RepID=UPI000358DE0A|nr:PHP domain-containing protein [Desulfovibrio sp. X2]EPR40879.1 PHP domain protein [Desulfovibrio sp. X2]
MSELSFIDCHVHTALHSACSTIPPDEACAAALATGLSGLVFTEHHYQWRERELARLRDLFPGLMLYSGTEITVEEGHDIVVITDSMHLDLPRPVPFSLLRDVLEAVREEAYAFVAHPFRWQDAITPEAGEIFDWADGLEMNSINILRPGWRWKNGACLPKNARLYEAAAERYGLSRLYNTDAHRVPCIGSFANVLPGPAPRDTAGLVALLRANEAREFQDTRRLAGFFPTG